MLAQQAGRQFEKASNPYIAVSNHPALSCVHMLDVSVRRHRLGWVSAADAGCGQNKLLGGQVLSARSSYRLVFYCAWLLVGYY